MDKASENTEKKSLANIFAEQRKSISEEIQIGVRLFEDSKNIPKIQIKFMSLRQRIIEDNHSLIEHFNRLKKRFRDIKGEEWVNVSTNSNYRWQSSEKGHIVESTPSLSDLKLKMDQVENHIDFYSESVKTIDNVLFGLKVRLDVDKLYEL